MFNYFVNAFFTSWIITYALTQSEIVCSKKEYSWKEAILNCMFANGQPMSFHGITGLSIEHINLRPGVTVWTSDFLYSKQHERGPCLCSFRYLTYANFYETNNTLFSYCGDFKYFFCRNQTNNLIEVLNNTWYNTLRCGSFSRDQLRSILKPGYYWIGETNQCGSDGIATNSTQTFWQTNASLCGAYSKDAGRHFRRCDSEIRQVCVSSGASLPLNLFDRSCFFDKTTESPQVQTLASMTYQPEWTKPTEISVTASTFETDTTPIVSHKKPSNLSTPDYLTSTTQISRNTETQMISNSTHGHARGSAHEHGDPDTRTETGSIAVIVVGVCFAALAGGIVMFIFIQRRYRCLFGKNTTPNSLPKTNNGTNNQPKKSKAHTLFNNIGYDTWDDNQKQNRKERNYKESPNNGTSSTNQHRTVEDKDTFYNQSNATFINDITKQQTYELSFYCCAVETENNVGKKEMSLDEYDTTISTRNGVYKTENVYNKFEPVNNSSSDVYDSTFSQGQTFETDDVYNKLNCKTKYGKFGTTFSENEDYDSVDNTLKSQNTQHFTDNVYN